MYFGRSKVDRGLMGEESTTTEPTELELCTKQVAEYEDQLKRLQAEYENYTKRVAKERDEVRNSVAAEVLLPVLDIAEDVRRAAQALTDTEGLTMIQGNFDKLFASWNVKVIESVGSPFDPFLHEALLRVETTEHPEGTVLEELQKGYTMHGKVIRHAKVKLAKAKQEE